VVGSGIRGQPGVAATMFETLAKHGINIEMISTSEIRITCIIKADRVADAVRELHQAFKL
jgi:aspartate kinase